MNARTMWWSSIIVIAVWTVSLPPAPWADTSVPLSRTSSTTDQQLHDEALYLKEEAVSIASRYEQPISQAPSDVYVIADEDIRNSGATDIPTLLRQVPGMEVMQTNAVDFNVSVRGNNQLLANKLLVQVDGRSIYIDQAGTILWKSLPIALTEIKRIEVLKGPASSVYGFNAFDGVVNIITKSPEEMKGTTLQVAGGELGTMLTNVVHAGTTGNWEYSLSGGHEQTQRWSDPHTPALNHQRLRGVLQHQSHTNGWFRAEAGISRSNPYNEFVNGTTSTTEQHNTQAHTVLSYEQGGLLIRGWWSSLFASDMFRTPPPLTSLLTLTDRLGEPRSNSSFNTYDFEARYNFNPFANLKLNIGTNFRRGILSSSILSNRTGENRLGFYGQGDWRILPLLAMSAGVRYELDTYVAPTISPRGALVYQLTPDQTIRFSGSIAYRSPNTYETSLSALTLIALPGFPPLSSPIVGSTDLRPEQIVSYELSHQGWWWNHRLRTRVTGFFNHISDLIAYRSTGNNPLNPTRTVNGGFLDVYGGEIGAEFLVTSWLSGFANYACQEVGQSSTGLSRRGFPHHKVNVGLRAKWSPFTGEILYYHIGAATYPLADLAELAPLFPPGTSLPQERVSSYNLVNLRLAYRLWQRHVGEDVQEAELALSVFNALNDTHREHPLGDLIGTRVMGWLTVKL